LEKIQLVKDERVNLLANPGYSTFKGLMTKINSSTSYPNNNYVNNYTPNITMSKITIGGESTTLKIIQNEGSTAIKNEQMKLEKMKQKQVIYNHK